MHTMDIKLNWIWFGMSVQFEGDSDLEMTKTLNVIIFCSSFQTLNKWSELHCEELEHMELIELFKLLTLKTHLESVRVEVHVRHDQCGMSGYWASERNKFDSSDLSQIYKKNYGNFDLIFIWHNFSICFDTIYMFWPKIGYCYCLSCSYRNGTKLNDLLLLFIDGGSGHGTFHMI